jgi:hypothetical protein
MNNLNLKYTLLLLLVGINLLSIQGALSAFTLDPYALFVGIFIDVPLGVLTLIVFWFAWQKEENKTLVRKYILIVGILVGAITSVLSTLLFILGRS